MKLHRLALPVAAAALVVATLPAVSATAAPDPYPPGQPTLSVSDASPTVGEAEVISGTGFAAGEQIRIVVDYQGTGGGAQGARAAVVPVALVIAPRDVQLSVTADPSGAFSTSVVLTEAGVVVITATGLTSGVSQSVTLLVQAAGGGRLPTTGIDGGTYLRLSLFGLGAVLVGAVLVAWAVRRRRQQSGAAPS